MSYTVPRTNPSKKTMAKSKSKPKSRAKSAPKSRGARTGTKTVRVGSWVANDENKIFMVTHLSDTTIAGRDAGGNTRNYPIGSVRIVAAPLRTGMKVRKGKQDYTVVQQSHTDAVLVEPAGGGEYVEVPSKGLSVTSQARYAGVTKAKAHPPAPAPQRQTQAAPPATQARNTHDDKHDMTPVYVHGAGDGKVLDYAWTTKQANEIVAKHFKFHEGVAKKTMADGERVYIAPAGDTQYQLDKAIFDLKRQGLARANPRGAVAGRSKTMATKKKASTKKASAKKSTKPRTAAQKAATARLVAMNKKRGGAKAKKAPASKKPRKNPIRTGAGRVLEARGGKKMASKLMLMRKEALARGEEAPQRIRLPGGKWLTYESASYILGHGGLKGGKAIKPRKKGETSGRRSGGSRGGPDAVTYIRENFGL